MSQADYQLAEINIAHARYDIDDPRFQPFVDLLDPVNAMAERMPGFIWRNAEPEPPGVLEAAGLGDPRLLVNMSVWQDIDSLALFVFKTAHLKVMNRRAEWFRSVDTPTMALWWVKAGHVPTPGEAADKLDALARTGPSPDAFTFKSLFLPDRSVVELDRSRFTLA
ncbi:DUF3291 domain-containing protein [Maricaulis parjimensis]|uniref:DUF3291 domain-containing protein n=1 Tax=Maricaulis parjimensis TaxID=144023 RepID=UPI001939B56F|nr:DUF3291 domain-containing protein [Maricaulis parjimensis]